MSVGVLLRSALVATGAVSQRVYPVLLPQTPTYPAISYQGIDNIAQKGTSDLKESRWQLDCWALTYAAAKSLAATVKIKLEEYHDMSQTPGILWARVVNELDDYDPEVNVYRVIVDVILHTTGD